MAVTHPRRFAGLTGGLVALSLGMASVARAQSVDITVDATNPGAPIERIWAFHGYDEANYTTTAEGKAPLDTLGAIHSTPPHIRMHFLLNTGDGTPSMKWGSTNVYTEDAAGNSVYSWTITDAIMDTVTGAGDLPYVEIGFMPEALSPHPVPYQNTSVTGNDSGSFYPPKDYAKWRALIQTWAAHLAGRYPNVAGSWLWELWNEPDGSYFNGTGADYEKLYDYTEAAIHQAIPTASLGGPAVELARSNLLKEFLQHCATGTNAVTGKTGTRLDLVSFHAKGTVGMSGGHIQMNLGHQLSLHQTGFTAVAAVAAFKHLPIYVSEADPDGCAACPVSSNSADGYRFSPAYGAYEVAMMKHTLDLEASMGVKVGGLLAWAFTFPGTAYFAGYRVLATNGIEMPVLGAFRLLGSLEGPRLPVTSSGAMTVSSLIANSVRGASPDIDAMATLDGDKIQVLVWNYHDELVTAAPATVRVAVKIPARFGSSVTLAHLRTDDTHGDAYTVWNSQGSPQPPSAAQVQALKAAMLPEALDAPQVLPVVGGSATVSFSLPRFGVSLLTLSAPTVLGGGGGAGGSAAGGSGASSPLPTGGNGGGDAGAGGQSGSRGSVGSGGQAGVAGQRSAGGAGQSGGIIGASAGAVSGGSETGSSNGCSCHTATGDPGIGLAYLLLLAVVVGQLRSRSRDLRSRLLR